MLEYSRQLMGWFHVLVPSPSTAKCGPLVEKYLGRLSLAYRRNLIDASSKLSGDQRFSDMTRSAVAGLIRQRLESLKPELEAAIDSDASAAAEKVERPANGKLAGWLVGLGVWFGVALVGWMMAELGAPQGMAPIFNLIGMVLGIFRVAS